MGNIAYGSQDAIPPTQLTPRQIEGQILQAQ
jgi:hypothetical protein